MAQSVVITGGASGIGWVMAQRFAALGHQLAICDADAAAVAQAKQVLPQALIEQVDVRDQVAMDGFLMPLITALAQLMWQYRMLARVDPRVPWISWIITNGPIAFRSICMGHFYAAAMPPDGCARRGRAVSL